MVWVTINTEQLGGCPTTEFTHEQFYCHREILNFLRRLFLKLTPEYTVYQLAASFDGPLV